MQGLRPSFHAVSVPPEWFIGCMTGETAPTAETTVFTPSWPLLKHTNNTGRIDLSVVTIQHFPSLPRRRAPLCPGDAGLGHVG